MWQVRTIMWSLAALCQVYKISFWSRFVLKYAKQNSALVLAFTTVSSGLWEVEAGQMARAFGWLFLSPFTIDVRAVDISLYWFKVFFFFFRGFVVGVSWYFLTVILTFKVRMKCFNGFIYYVAVKKTKLVWKRVRIGVCWKPLLTLLFSCKKETRKTSICSL